ncbi:hypothetical protein NDU88_004238 [Pleurodeles waltl]|uniref:Uncharacterized protein n=1 Tax=Pleurodeles waltl TaxID=8319 RepID=A0AAV7PCC5_PLEWA|nr:hypothetical protein NDU88_004238 [Pleurodeles waltl]
MRRIWRPCGQVWGEFRQDGELLYTRELWMVKNGLLVPAVALLKGRTLLQVWELEGGGELVEFDDLSGLRATSDQGASENCAARVGWGNFWRVGNYRRRASELVQAGGRGLIRDGELL